MGVTAKNEMTHSISVVTELLTILHYIMYCSCWSGWVRITAQLQISSECTVYTCTHYRPQCTANIDDQTKETAVMKLYYTVHVTTSQSAAYCYNVGL